MPQKNLEKNGYSRATLADIGVQMAKSRMTESARRAIALVPGPKVQDANTAVKKVIERDVPKPARQPSDRRLDEEALSRMDDEGGAAAHANDLP